MEADTHARSLGLQQHLHLITLNPCLKRLGLVRLLALEDLLLDSMFQHRTSKNMHHTKATLQAPKSYSVWELPSSWNSKCMSLKAPAVHSRVETLKLSPEEPKATLNTK